MENTLPFEDAKKKAIEMAEKEIKEHGYPKASSIPVHKNILLQMQRDGTLKPDKEIQDEQKAKYKEYLVAGFLANNFGYTPDGKIIEEDLELNNDEHDFQAPVIIKDIEISVKKEKDDDVNYMNISVTDSSGTNYIAHVSMIFPVEENKETPNKLWIYLIDKSNKENIIFLTYHWFKDCLFEQALKKANITLKEFFKLFMEERQYELEVIHRLHPNNLRR